MLGCAEDEAIYLTCKGTSSIYETPREVIIDKKNEMFAFQLNEKDIRRDDERDLKNGDFSLQKLKSDNNDYYVGTRDFKSLKVNRKSLQFVQSVLVRGGERVYYCDVTEAKPSLRRSLVKRYEYKIKNKI